ncbi:MAG: vitamin K epoxide reductase family protein, partial [bacterium]
PVALLGLVAYTTLFALTLLRGHVAEHLDNYIPLAIFGISFIGVLYSAYLTYLELFVIYAICRWCVSSALIITAIFLLSLPGLKAEADASG